MVKYSKDERKAMEMVEGYFSMIEGMRGVKGEIPSQNREEMINFLGSKKGESDLIRRLSNWTVHYDDCRKKVREATFDRMNAEIQLYELLGRPQFS